MKVRAFSVIGLTATVGVTLYVTQIARNVFKERRNEMTQVETDEVTVPPMDEHNQVLGPVPMTIASYFVVIIYLPEISEWTFGFHTNSGIGCVQRVLPGHLPSVSATSFGPVPLRALLNQPAFVVLKVREEVLRKLTQIAIRAESHPNHVLPNYICFDLSAGLLRLILALPSS